MVENLIISEAKVENDITELISILDFASLRRVEHSSLPPAAV